MGDNGNPIKLHDQIIKILKHHNNLEKDKENPQFLPIKNIKSIARSRKKKEIVDRVLSRWEYWKDQNSNMYKNLNRQQKLKIQEKRVFEQIFTNNIFIEFDQWLDNIPDEIDYALGTWKLVLVSTKLSTLERRLKSFYQCKYCRGIECTSTTCRRFTKMAKLLARKSMFGC